MSFEAFHFFCLGEKQKKGPGLLPKNFAHIFSHHASCSFFSPFTSIEAKFVAKDTSSLLCSAAICCHGLWHWSWFQRGWGFNLKFHQWIGTVVIVVLDADWTGKSSADAAAVITCTEYLCSWWLNQLIHFLILFTHFFLQQHCCVLDDDEKLLQKVQCCCCSLSTDLYVLY